MATNAPAIPSPTRPAPTSPPAAAPAPPPLPPAPAVPKHLEVRFPPELLDADPEVAAEAFARALRGYARRLATDDRKRRFCMLADTPLYEAIDTTIVEAYGGVHPKHWVTDYHDFFVHRINPGESVLDLGCGVGMVAASIAARVPGSRVVGVDWSQPNLATARRVAADKHLADRLTYIHADICRTRVEPPASTGFDVVMLSNVLEHITDRPQRLRLWADWYRPRRILLRVPAIDRTWQTALKQHLGIDSRSDPTHETEYTEDQLRAEIAEAGLTTTELISRWGEYWACATPGQI